MTHQPNIVFVFADQLRAHNLGCYGEQQVKTPNFDRLAREGTRFRHAISTHPVCGPFRGMLMTGNFPIKNGMILTDHFLRNPAPCFAEICRAGGYKTAYIGKWHLDGYGRKTCIPPERRLGFDYWRALECTHDYFNSVYFADDETEARTWEGYDAIAQTADACSYIRKQDQPFCLFLSWGPPHGPYQAPREYMERWAGREIHLRANVNDFETCEYLWSQADTVLPECYQTMRDSWSKRQREEDSATYHEQTKGYFAAIETLDDCMGRIVEALRGSGQLDNTILVLTSDHGDNLGSHRQSAKQLPFEESISIPFLVRYPRKVPANTVHEALLRPIDMMPTVLELAGIPHHSVDGRSVHFGQAAEDDGLDGVLIQKALALSTNWISNGNGPWAGVRTKTHTYARLTNHGTPWLLYDNVEDPFQLRNLIGLPEHSDLQRALDHRTSQLLREAGEPENPDIYADIILRERQANAPGSSLPEVKPEVTAPQAMSQLDSCERGRWPH